METEYLNAVFKEICQILQIEHIHAMQLHTKLKQWEVLKEFTGV
jgi:hypothetical protein